MTTTLRYSLVCLIALMASGCGGGSSSSSDGAVTQATSSAPSQAWFYDADGAEVARMQFHYPDELTINVQLHSVGPDMVWDTEDDASHPYLQCQYMSAPTPLLRYPDLFFHGMAGSPTGATGLAVLGLSYNGPMKCPVRSGRRLQQESGHVTGLFIPAFDFSYSYLINAELEHFGGTATEVLNYEFDGLDTTVAEILALTEFTTTNIDLETVDEPDLPIIVDHTQTNTVIFDAEQRPLSIDLAADSSWTAVLDEYCLDAHPIAVSIKLLRWCSSAYQTRSYRYLDDSVEEDTQRYNGSTSADLYTNTATRLADRVIVHPGTADAGPESGWYYDSYFFNASEQVTAMVRSSYGDDGVWGTEDDEQRDHETYHYDHNGRLSEVGSFGGVLLKYGYYNDGKLKQVDEVGGQSEVPSRRTLISYRQGVPAKITVQRREDDGNDGYVLQTRIVMEFAPSEEEWAELFSPVPLIPEYLMPPSIDDLMHFQPMR
ncbi:hypothetical protein Y5S_02251 [Alcanivorax nanhaiticus]|uniref:YD repeat-containing protein n=1 Tax=Alcanivorax nanhaiticus TaxID=1177154 RepID=A0A095SIL6_9GAMM|nr:hypothetical protein [Alcanivorax nanhaiticus]KGD64496.1 hypothetical protein Y5S_02251 [Alcanivorax nanhaiticus]